MPDAPAVPRPAASLLLLRMQGGGLEVLMGVRPLSVRAFPGATVFPGGRIEARDADAEVLAGGAPTGPAPRGAAFAAVRETFEETGVCVSPAQGEAAQPRHEALGGRAADLRRLVPFARWITPWAEPYRFDTWFYVAEASPSEAETALEGDELISLAWSRASEVLARANVRLLPPTRDGLERLAACADAAQALAMARRGPFVAGAPLDP